MIEAIALRKSIRTFTDRKPEPEKVENLLRAAMRAPSAMNGQPWEFVVVDDPAIIDIMKTVSPGAAALRSAPMTILVLEKILPRREEMGMTWISQQDLGAATENILLQAVAEGLGAVWVGVAPSEGTANLCRALNLPETVKPYAIVGFGYPTETTNLKPADRFDPSRIHYNTY